LQQLYTTHHAAKDSGRVVAAYTWATSRLGSHFRDQFDKGQNDSLNTLRREQGNLLNARTLARASGRWDDVMGCMQALWIIYDHLGRRNEWMRLVEELADDLVDRPRHGPVPGRDEHWSLFTEYRIRIATERRDLATATRLQQARLSWDRQLAEAALAVPADQLTGEQHYRIQIFAVNEQNFGRILLEQHNPECMSHFLQAFDLYRRADAPTDQGDVAILLGTAHIEVPSVRDLDQAEQWYRCALDLYEQPDRLRRAQATAQLGRVARERFRDSRAAGAFSEALAHLTSAAALYEDALETLPDDATDVLAAVHNQLGNTYRDGGKPETALAHYQRAIMHQDNAGDRYEAGRARFNVAFMLANDDRMADALLYAQAALRDFEPYGANAADIVAATQQLIDQLQPQDIS